MISDASVLTRFSQASLSQAASDLHPTQALVDGMVSRFVEETGDWRSLAAMATGSLFYRFGRLGTLALASRAGQAAPILQVASYGIGLASEVTAFQAVNDVLSPVGANLVFAQNGGEGRAQGSPLHSSYWDRWRTSFVQFGLLKIGGAAALGQNPFMQHLAQDSAMVAGHQVTARLGWTNAPDGNLAEQFLHAEVTNLQMGLGMGLLHQAAPGLAALERGLDLHLRSAENISRGNYFSPRAPSPAFALAYGSETRPAPVSDFGRGIEGPTILKMEGVPSERLFPRSLESLMPPEKSGVEITDPIVYPPEIERILRSVEERMRQPGYFEGRREELLNKRPLDDETDTLFTYQLLNLGRRLEARIPGASVQVVDAEVLFEKSFSRDEEIDPQYMTEALALLGNRATQGSVARRVVEIHIPVAWMLERVSADPLRAAAELGHLNYLHLLESRLGEVVHLTERDDDFMRYRIPTLSMMEAILQTAHGSNSIQLHPVAGDITRDDNMRVKRKRVSVVGFAAQPFFVPVYGGIMHPASFALHDLFEHVIDDAEVADPYPEVAGNLYDHVGSHFPPSPFRERLMDLLADLQLKGFEKNEARDMSRLFFQRLEKGFLGSEEERRDVERYLQSSLVLAQEVFREPPIQRETYRYFSNQVGYLLERVRAVREGKSFPEVFPPANGRARTVAPRVSPTIKIIHAQDAFWVVDTETEKEDRELYVSVGSEYLPAGGSLRIRPGDRVVVGTEEYSFQIPDEYGQSDSPYALIPKTLRLSGGQELSYRLRVGSFAGHWSLGEEVPLSDDAETNFRLALLSRQFVSGPSRAPENDTGLDLRLELRQREERGGVRMQVDRDGIRISELDPGSISEPFMGIFLEWLSTQALVRASRLHFEDVSPEVLKDLSFGLVHSPYSWVEVGLRSSNIDRRTIASASLEEAENLRDRFGPDYFMDLHAAPRPSFLPTSLGFLHREYARGAFDRWAQERIHQPVPTLLQIDEGHSLPAFNRLGVRDTMDDVLGHLITPGTRFLEIGFGRRLDTLEEVQRRGGIALGLEKDRVYPPDVRWEEVTEGDVDVLFVNGSPFLLYANHWVALPAALDILSHFARSEWVVIQSYNPRTPFEILRHAEELSRIEFEPFYYRAEAAPGEPPIFPSDYSDRPDTAPAVLIARRVRR
ncbi:MAG: hypothetical protein U1F57_01510 [bacterium]